MQESRKPSGLEKASTVLAPTLNTLIFIMIARDLGADALGSAALFLSLGACITLSFDMSRAWGGGAGNSARAILHGSFAAAGLMMALFGWMAAGCECVVALGLFTAYHGASSAALAMSKDGGHASAAALADSVVRIAVLVALFYVDFSVGAVWIAACFAAGGLAALLVAAARPASVSLSAARSEFAAASGGAFVFSILVGLLAWLDKPLLWYLDGEISLGFYFAVQRTVVFIGAAGIIITGMVSERFAALSKAEGLRLVTLMERYASLCVVPMTAFYLAFSEQLVETFFGADYAPHHELVYPLAVAGLFLALAAPSVTWSASSARWRDLSAAGLISLGALVVVPLAIVLDTYDVEISFAVAVGCLASAMIFYVMVRRAPASEGARFHAHLPKHIACAALMSAILFWMSGSFASVGFAELVALAIFGVLLYGLLLYLFGEFMQGEWGEFKALRGV
jgi:O-antigen/teichoic acid export membrane protein